MANDYYTPSGSPLTSSPGASSTMRAEFTLLLTAFNKLPALSGFANQVVVVNAGGTALTSSLAPILTSGVVTASGGTVARALSTIFGEIVNVKDRGALGDGTTDDTAAFVSAIATGGRIFVPAGTYIVDNTTISTTNCAFFGEGTDSIIKKKANTVGISPSDVRSWLFNVTGRNVTVTFESLKFDVNRGGQVLTNAGATPGNTTPGAIENFNGSATVIAVGGVLSTLSATQTAVTDRLIVKFTDCFFTGGISSDLYFAGTINQVGAVAQFYVHHCYFTDQGPSIAEYHDGVSAYDGIIYPASGYSFSSTGVTGTAINVVDAARVVITDSVFHQTRNLYAATITSGYDINSYNMPGCAIHISMFDGGVQVDPLEWNNVVITGNRFFGCGRPNWLGNGIGVIDFYTRAANSVISNNSFRMNTGDAIRGKVNAKNLTITGNTIENVAASCYYAQAINIHLHTVPAQRGNYVIANNVISGTSNGVTVIGDDNPVENSDPGVADDPDSKTNNLIVANNLMHDLYCPSFTNAVLQAAHAIYGFGVWIRHVADVQVTGNTVHTNTTATGSGGDENGIILIQCAGAMNVSGNIVRNVLQAGILFSSTDGSVMCNGNTVDGTGAHGINIANIGSNVANGNYVANTGNIGILAGSSLASYIMAHNNTVINVVGNSASNMYGISTGNANARTTSFIGNNIKSVSNAGAGSAYGFNVTLNATAGVPSDNFTATVIGNTVDTTEESGIFAHDISGIIANNVFNNCNTVASTAHGALFINGVTNCGKLQVHGNTSVGTGLWPTTGGTALTAVAGATIATGVVTVNLNAGIVYVDTEAAAATDDLDTINGLAPGSITTFKTTNNARDVTFKDATGNMFLNGDFYCTHVEDSITLREVLGSLYEVSRSYNEALTTPTLTIATGVVTATSHRGVIAIDTEAAAATDDLATVNGLADGSIVTFRAANGARDVVFKDGTGNFKMAGDFTLNNTEDTITFRVATTTLYEMCRSDNGA